MTSTPCQSVALDRIIAPRAAKIAELFGILVEAILTIAENVRETLHKLGTCCQKSGRRFLALRPGLSRPMMPTLGFLPPSAGALYILARKRSPEFERSVMMDLDVSLSARRRDAWEAVSPRLVSDGDDGEERLMDHEKPEAKDNERV